MNDSKGTSGGVGIPTVLTLVFVVLKLTDNIDWSWWWVFSPLWISFGLILLVLLIFGAILLFFKNKGN